MTYWASPALDQVLVDHCAISCATARGLAGQRMRHLLSRKAPLDSRRCSDPLCLKRDVVSRQPDMEALDQRLEAF